MIELIMWIIMSTSSHNPTVIHPNDAFWQIIISMEDDGDIGGESGHIPPKPPPPPPPPPPGN